MNSTSSAKRPEETGFPHDLIACAEWCFAMGLSIVCDTSVEMLIRIGTGHFPGSPGKPGVLGIFDAIPVLSLKETCRAFSKNPQLVWISLGSQFGSPLFGEEAKAVLRNNRIAGFAGASALSGCYGSLRLYRWRDGVQNELMVHFRDGTVVGVSLG